jgi:predicted nucleic acid-binding protein
MAEAARAVFRRIEDRTERVAISLVVVLEVVFTLERTYRVSKERVRDMMRDFVSMPGVQLADKHLCLEALDIYAHFNISFGDAYNIASMHSQGLDAVYSWDTDFDRVPGVMRIQPE